MHTMRYLTLKVPPPIVTLLAGVLMQGLAWLAPAFSLPIPYRLAIALTVGAVGILIALAGVAQFRRARTTVLPMAPERSTALVVAGVYRWSRNPMYLGFLLLLIAWAIALSNLATLVVPPLYVIYLDRYQIEPEERALLKIFGESFVAYRKMVRRWI